MTRPAGELFAAGGPLAAALPGYAPRTVQSRMAERVESAIRHGDRLMVEAGTGTGKSLAYLVPSVTSGRKVIVSTATRNLQDQLADKDVPLVREALGSRVRVAMLKGRGNYLCRHRLALTREQPDGLDRASLRRLQAVNEWAARTTTGDLAEFGDLSDGSPLWPRVTSTADNCLGQRCPAFDDCWVLHARRAAQKADLVIVNHHLLLADLTLREEGFGELLPGADAVILDEAHRLPDIAGRFFGTALSGRQLRELARDTRAEADAIGGDMPDLDEALDELEAAESRFGAALGGEEGRMDWSGWRDRAGVAAAAEALEAAVAALVEVLEAFANRSRGLEATAGRAQRLLERLGVLGGDDENIVRWLERRRGGWSWHATPLDVAPPFERAMAAHPGAWVFTSATLSVGGRMDYFAERLGLQDADGLILDSPFDYRRNGRIYLPRQMPAPGGAEYDQAVAELSARLIEASGGGAFLLCTSHRAVRRYREILADRVELPLLAQGELGKNELLERFRERPDAVLLGTTSFWEGVDVRGRSLRLVIIDRLPFAAPGDPVLAARLNALRERGESPFVHYQLPQAVIALKQGVGRLIRDADDRGLLAICDPRLRGKGYGRVFLDSLPEMPVLDDVEAAGEFLRGLATA